MGHKMSRLLAEKLEGILINLFFVIKVFNIFFLFFLSQYLRALSLKSRTQPGFLWTQCFAVHFFRVVTLIFVSMCLVLMVYSSVTLMLSRLPLLSLLSILVAQRHFHLFIIFPLDIRKTHFSHWIWVIANLPPVYLLYICMHPGICIFLSSFPPIFISMCSFSSVFFLFLLIFFA